MMHWSESSGRDGKVNWEYIEKVSHPIAPKNQIFIGGRVWKFQIHQNLSPIQNFHFFEIELNLNSEADKWMLFVSWVSLPYDTPLKRYRKWSYLDAHDIWPLNRRLTLWYLDRPPPCDVAQCNESKIESLLKKIFIIFGLQLNWHMCQILQALGIRYLKSDLRNLKYLWRFSIDKSSGMFFTFSLIKFRGVYILMM